MRRNYAALFVGFLFAMGLGISGMSRPEKVFGFLDFFGHWDASLLFVMIGAILVHFTALKIILRQKAPLFSNEFHWPQQKRITFSLITGSFIFGVGWGLSGYCPGPALVSLMGFQSRPLIFVISMLAGMFIFRIGQAQINKNRS